MLRYLRCRHAAALADRVVTADCVVTADRGDGLPDNFSRPFPDTAIHMTMRTSQMADSVSAASRVGALLLSVVVFAAMWESDTPAESGRHWLASRAAGQAPLAARTPGLRMEEAAARWEQLMSPAAVSHTLLPSDRPRATLAAGRLPAVALPDGIVPGCYRVVETDGSVHSILITEGMAGAGQPVQPRRCYTVGHGRRTRYFIRIEPSRLQAAASETETRRRAQQ